MSYQVVLTIAPAASPLTVTDIQYEDLLAQGLILSATPGGVDSDPADPAYLVGDANVNFQHAVQVSETLDVGTNLTVSQRLSAAGFLNPFGQKVGRPIPRSYSSWSTVFSSGHGWTAGGTGTASSAAETTVFQTGNQSLRVTTTGAGAQSYVRKTGLTALDLTGKAFRIKMRVLDPTHLDHMSLYVASESGFSNYYQFDFYTHSVSNPNQVFMRVGEWYEFTIPWSQVTTRLGTYTLTNGAPTTAAMRTGFTAFSLAVYDDNTANAITYYVDSFEIVPDTAETFPKGVFVPTWDDGWLTQFTNARPVFDDRGMRATVYPIVSYLGNNASYQTLANLKSLRDFSGWEIGGHAFLGSNHDQANGFASLSAANVEWDLVRLKMWMQKNGFLSDNLAYPHGAFGRTTDNVNVYEIARQYFATARLITGNYEVFPPSMPTLLKSITGINDGIALGGRTVVSLTAAGGDLDRIAANGGMLVGCFHKCTPTTATDSSEISIAGLATLLDACTSRGIQVATMSEVVNYYS